jgi:3D (Asp-Asp-Asp) domain-containing protein
MVPSTDCSLLTRTAQAIGSYVADLVERIINGFKDLAPLLLAIGCQSGDPPATVPVEQAPVSVAEEPVEDTGPKQLGKFNITFYYVVGEDELKRPANGNQSNASINPPAADDVTIYAGGGSCDPIAQVSRTFAQQLRIQGTGKLRDGRVLNVFGACKCDYSPCFKVISQQWGTAGTGRPLHPFRTVAVDPKLVKLGSLLYIPLLEGRTMPGRAPWGGFVHDGCVVADDTGGGIKYRQIDLFVGKRGWFLGLSGSGGSHSWARHVPVFDGSAVCERKGRKVARKTGAI